MIMNYPQLKSKLGQTEAKQNVRVNLKTGYSYTLLFHHNYKLYKKTIIAFIKFLR